MKKIKTIFVAAILLAVTGAFTSKNSSSKRLLAVFPSTNCYQNVYKPKQCGSTGTQVCTISGTTYYNSEGCYNVLYFTAQ